MSTSQNGWRVYTSSDLLDPLPWITGRVASGHVWWIFDYLCRRFDKEVEKIKPAESWGWNNRDIRGAKTTSNHASATAIDLNAPDHPLGKHGTFSQKQIAAIERILKDCMGAIRWGGHYKNRIDAMHFEIDVTPKELATIVKKLKNQEDEMNKPQEDKLDAALAWAKSGRAQSLAAHTVALRVEVKMEALIEALEKSGKIEPLDNDAIAERVADELAERLKGEG